MRERIFSGIKTGWNQGMEQATKRPATSFFILLALLFGVIALGNHLRAPETGKTEKAADKKESAVFTPAKDAAFLSVPAEVKKENVVQVVALTPGVVANIFTAPGKNVASGQTLLQLTADYQSGRAETEKQIARNTDALTQELADIDKKIFALEEKRIKKDDELSGTEEDIELRRLKQDRETRRTTIENSRLAARVTELGDAVLKPKVFASGTVESIRVKRGDFVSPGDVLATIRTTKGAATLEALVSRKTALLFDPSREAELVLGTETLKLVPTYFAKTEDENGLFSVLFTLSAAAEAQITDGELLSVRLPLRASDAASILIPIDAIFQDAAGATVLVSEGDRAVTKTVTLGHLYGSFAEVKEGLPADAKIILNRAVIAGDEIVIR